MVQPVDQFDAATVRQADVDQDDARNLLGDLRLGLNDSAGDDDVAAAAGRRGQQTRETLLRCGVVLHDQRQIEFDVSASPHAPRPVPDGAIMRRLSHAFTWPARRKLNRSYLYVGPKNFVSYASRAARRTQCEAIRKQISRRACAIDKAIEQANKVN